MLWEHRQITHQAGPDPDNPNRPPPNPHPPKTFRTSRIRKVSLKTKPAKAVGDVLRNVKDISKRGKDRQTSIAPGTKAGEGKGEGEAATGDDNSLFSLNRLPVRSSEPTHIPPKYTTGP